MQRLRRSFKIITTLRSSSETDVGIQSTFQLFSDYTLGSNRNKSELATPKIVKRMKQVRLLIFPRTKVVSKFPMICDDIIRAQKSPNNQLFRSSLATSLVQDPCATHKIEAPIPHIQAPTLTITQTKPGGIPKPVTITKPVASKIEQAKALRNIDFLYPNFLTIKEENKDVTPNVPQMHMMAVWPMLLKLYSSQSLDTMFWRLLNDVNMIMNEIPRKMMRLYCCFFVSQVIGGRLMANRFTMFINYQIKYMIKQFCNKIHDKRQLVDIYTVIYQETPKQIVKLQQFSGRIERCHRLGPSSILGCSIFCIIHIEYKSILSINSLNDIEQSKVGIGFADFGVELLVFLLEISILCWEQKSNRCWFLCL